MTKLRTAVLAAFAASGVALSPAAFADAPGTATSGSAGATATRPGPDSQPGTGEPPASLNLGRPDVAAGSGAGASKRITKEEIHRSLEAAGYTDIDVAREGDAWVARGMLNGAAQRLRIDPRTGQAARQ